MADLPRVEITGTEYNKAHNPGIPLDVYNWLYMGGQMPSFANFAYGAIAGPPNWVQPGGGFVAPVSDPVSDPELPEIVVEGTMPPLDTMSPGELEELGTDSAFAELERRGFRFTDAFVWPPPPVYTPIIPKILTEVATRFLLPLVGLFTPMPEGDRDLDEAPAPGGRLGPPRRPGDTPLDPIMPPNWEDLSRPNHEFEIDDYPFGKPAPGPLPWDRTDLVRRVLPTGDYPGMLDDPFGFPEIAQPQVPLRPGTRPVPLPVGPTTFPYSDPFPLQFPDPRRIAIPEPYVPPRIAPDRRPAPVTNPVPDVVADPVTGFPPRIGDPVTFAPPRLVPSVPLPRPPSPIGDPYGTPDIGDFPDPYQEPPNQAQDPCDCGKQKPKKKKKKTGRAVCYKGTYYENSKSLTKVRRERIPCKREKTKKAKSPSTITTNLFGLPRS